MKILIFILNKKKALMEDKREKEKQVSEIMKEFNLLLKRKCFGTILHKNSITIQILILCEVKLSYPTNVKNNNKKTAANQTQISCNKNC